MRIDRLLVSLLALATLTVATARAAGPENLARKAQASASSEHNGRYLARFAVDGKIPAAASGAADLDAAWCVLKAKSGDQADFTLQWPEPVDVADIIYWGRTSWYMNECWKDYEVYLDDAATPAAKGTFQMVHGPQRVTVAKTKARKLSIKFLNSYGGMNPGAAEIEVYGESMPPAAYQRYLKQAHGTLAHMPWVMQNDPAKIRKLIDSLRTLHGSDYAGAEEHLARLTALEKTTERLEAAGGAASADDREQLAADLERLEREVLLLGVDKIVVVKRHEINASHVYTYHYEGFSPGGSMCVVSLADPAAKPVELVASPTGQILDTNVSYDGRTILFSWRKTADEGYHIWKINADGSGLAQLTSGEWHDYNPCWLPGGGIAFLTTRNPQFAYCWHAPVGILHRMEEDGSNIRRISANYLNDFTPTVLDDGRLLYTRWEYVDRPAIPIQSLWAINPDGTGLAGYFGNRVLSPGTFMEAQPISGTTKIVCTMTGHNGPTRGAIGVIDRSRGVNTQEAIENLTPDTPVPPVNRGCGNTDGTKQYSSPYPLDSERFLVSIRGPLLVRTFDGSCQSVALDSPDDGMQWLCARPLRPRPVPPVVPSKLPPNPPPYATLVLQDVYDGLEPYVQRGEVKRLLIVRDLAKNVRIDPSLRAFDFQFPVISCGATYAAKHVFGSVPVEEDGSACFQVPAMTPVYFIAQDAEGHGLQRMRTFSHLMPGEVQGCVGCHEHRLQTGKPRISLAGFRPPRQIEPPEWGAGGFDYTRVVQPVIDKYCVKCHDAVSAPNHVDLTAGKTDFFNVSYDVLARENQARRGSPFVNWIPTYNGQEWNILEVTPKTWGSPVSKLTELIESGHPDKDGKLRVEMDPVSRRRIYAWIDLNVPYYGTSETAYPEKVGCRRLYPEQLDKVLAEVASRRCVECHKDGKVPRRVWTRITEPELNGFLLAPLAKSAGGSEKCGRPVFAGKDDPDYQKILALFQPITETLAKRPRMDMPGAEPACDVCRRCQ